MSTAGVHITIQDSEGKTLDTFPAEQGKSFLEMSENRGIEIPYSCCSGACFVCAAKVQSGMDAVNPEQMSVPLVEVESDQVLTCIGWVKDECFTDGKFHEIVLQKLL